MEKKINEVIDVKKCLMVSAITIFAIFAVIMKCRNDGLSDFADSLSEELAKVDSLMRADSTTYQKYIRNNQKLKRENERLLEIIRDKGTDLRLWTTIEGEWNEVLVEGETIRDLTRRLIRGKKYGVEIDGIVGTDSFRVLVRRPPLFLDVAASETKNGVWLFSVDTHDPTLRITDISGTVKPYRKKWNWYMTFGGGYADGFVTNLGIGLNGYELSALTGRKSGIVFRRQIKF